MRLSLALLSLLLPAGAVSAQSGFDLHTLGEDYFQHGPVTFRRTCAADVDGDRRRDVFVLAGDRPVASIGPGLYEALVALDTTAVDIAAYRSDRDGAPSGCLVSGPGPQLELWTINPLANRFVPELLGSSAWSGVVELQTADVTGDGFLDVLGITADRTAVIWLASPFGQGAEDSSTYLNETLHRLAPVEWDGTAGAELALLTSGGLRVIELDGTPHLAETTDGDDSDRFTFVEHRTLVQDRLTTLVKLGSVYNLFTADMQVWDGLTQLGVFDPVAIVSGDHDGDGRDDVCISQRTTGQLVYFQNQGGHGVDAFTWSPGACALWDPTAAGSGSAPAPSNEAYPALEDLDDDGDGDVLFPVQSELALSLLRNDAVAHLDQAPTVQAATYVYDSSTLSGVLQLQLDAPEVPPRWDDELVAVVWRQAGMGEGWEAPTESIAIHKQVLPVSGWPLSIALPLDAPPGAYTLFHVSLRLAKHVDGELVGASSSAVWTFTMSPISFGALVEGYGLDPDDFLPTEILYDGSEDTASGGWTGPMPCIPCFADDAIPAEGPAQ